jgi:uncharacterized protein YjbJ (UPF0337 family)
MMNKQEIEGSAEKAKGKVKEVVGKGTHSPKTVAEGKAEQVVGETKKQAGKVQDRLKKDEYPDSQRI